MKRPRTTDRTNREAIAFWYPTFKATVRIEKPAKNEQLALEVE